MLKRGIFRMEGSAGGFTKWPAQFLKQPPEINMHSAASCGRFKQLFGNTNAILTNLTGP
jgi:hypothetical protein